MGTKQFNNYEDLITHTRASKGHALRPVSYGDEIFGNSGFDDTSEWTLALDSISISNGKLIYDATNNIRGADQQVSVEAGKIYQLSFEVLSGTARLYLSEGYASTSLISDLAAANYGVGKHVVNVVANGSYDQIGFSLSKFSGGTACEIDDFSLKEVTFDESDGTLTLFEHPNNVPRVEYDADGNRLGLLVEESRTNSLTYSEDFTQWNLSTNATRTFVSDVSAPNGVQGVYKFVSDGGANPYVYLTGVAVNGQHKSIWARTVSGTGSVGLLSHNSVSESEFNLTEKWQRFDIAVDTSELGGGNFYAVDFRAGDLTEVYVWGAQVETGSFPTSYIKTTGSTATRSADVASIPVADFGYNQSEGTLFVEANAPDGTNQNRLTQLVTSGGATNRVVDLHRVTDDIVMYNGTTTITGDAFDASNDIKAAGAYKSGSYALVSDGGSASTNSDATVYSPDTLTVGMNGASSRQLNGHIKKLMYIPRRVTNAQLISLTE